MIQEKKYCKEEILEKVEKLNAKSVIIQADVGYMEEAKRLINESIKELEHVDILVNNVEITRSAMLHKMFEEEWNEVIRINLKGTYNCIRCVM